MPEQMYDPACNAWNAIPSTQRTACNVQRYIRPMYAADIVITAGLLYITDSSEHLLLLLWGCFLATCAALVCQKVCNAVQELHTACLTQAGHRS